MSTNVNIGSQELTFDFKEPAEGGEFNKHFRDILEPGVYTGGACSDQGSNVVRVAPFSALINATDTDDDKMVKVTASSNADINISSLDVGHSDIYLVLILEWSDVIDNYCEFTTRLTTDSALQNEIILCRIGFDGSGNVNSVDDSYKTAGLNKAWTGELSSLTEGEVDLVTAINARALLAGSTSQSFSADVLTTNGNVNIGGDCDVTGALTKGSGTFKIDYPLDPKNKWLYHGFVESPQASNIYYGRVEFNDENREIEVELPEYFEEINTEFNYSLTCIGKSADVYISKEVKDNKFSIAGGYIGLKVDWQIIAKRNDKLQKAHAHYYGFGKGEIVEKTQAEKDREYQNPELYKEEEV